MNVKQNIELLKHFNQSCYEFGVEYQCGGEKPKLPDWVLVWYRNDKTGLEGHDSVLNLNWKSVTSFKVVDRFAQAAGFFFSDNGSERVIVDMNYLKQANCQDDKFSVGSKVFVDDDKYTPLEVKCHLRNGNIVAESDSGAFFILPAIRFSQYKNHKQMVTEEAEKQMLTSKISAAQRKTISRLYDVGMLTMKKGA